LQYAGFWRRAAAFGIDLVLLPVIWFAIVMLLAVAGGLLAGILDTSETTDERFLDRAFGPVAGTLLVVVPVLYSAVLEAAAGGTVGKLLVGIHVAETDGSRLRFVRALVRAIGKMVSSLFFGLGLLPAALTERRQAFHDLVGGTVVLAGRRGSSSTERVLGPPGDQADAPVMVRES
jgi:uncharacterized RDD family membrane protein YckC